MPQQKGVAKVLGVFGIIFGIATGGIAVFLNWLGDVEKLNQAWLRHGFINVTIAAMITIFVIAWLIMTALKKAMGGGMGGMPPGGFPGM